MNDFKTAPIFPTLSLKGESWRQAKNKSPKYFVSNMGRILTTSQYGHPGRIAIVKSYAEKSGYIRTCVDDKTTSVHRLVAEAWIDNPNNKPEVNHIDGNRSNNSLSNLEWVTHQENVQHTVKMGRAVDNRGENCGNHVLKGHQITKIRNDSRKYKEIAAEYGVSEHTIKDIRNHRTWKHIG